MVGIMSGFPPPGKLRATTCDPLRLFRTGRSIFGRNQGRVAPGHARARVEGSNGDIAEPGYCYFP